LPHLFCPSEIIPTYSIKSHFLARLALGRSIVSEFRGK
jgi:hypothetical protein